MKLICFSNVTERRKIERERINESGSPIETKYLCNVLTFFCFLYLLCNQYVTYAYASARFAIDCCHSFFLGRLYKHHKKEQCNLNLVTLLVSAKTVTESHNVTKSNDFM